MNNPYYEFSQDKDQNQSTSFINQHGPTFYYPSHFHKKTEITYVLQGYVNSNLSGTSYRANIDEIIFVPEFTPHSYSTSTDANRWVYLPTSELFADIAPIFTEKTLPYILPHKEFNRKQILPLLEEMYEIRTDENLTQTYKALYFKGVTDLLFSRLLKEYSAYLCPKNQQIDLIFSIHDYVEKHYQEEITLEDLAKHFGYNKFYFSKLFNSLFSDSLSNYVNNVRINKFIEKVSSQKNSQGTILYWAYDCGFNSMPTFYRAFYKIYQCSPNDFLKK